MSTFLQTPAGDLALDANKRLVLVTDPDQQAAQKLQNLFRSFLGEWFLDTRIGIPYFQQVFVKNPNLTAIRQLFQKVILSVPWISTIQTLNLNLLPTRELSFTFAAKTQSGAVITGGSGQPFIVTGGV